MTIGLEEAGRRLGFGTDVVLAADSDAEVLEIYRDNIPKANCLEVDVAKLFGGKIGSPFTMTERTVSSYARNIDILVGGPPCQGHSDLNNHTRRLDPKNELYLRMARAAEVLKPRFIVIENVATVKWDKKKVVQQTTTVLQDIGYDVGAEVLDLHMTGVPQRRHRFVLVASMIPRIRPHQLFKEINARWQGHPPRSVRWAIHDLMSFNGNTEFDTPSTRSPENVRRMAHLFENGLYDLPNSKRPDCHRDGDHSYRSVYGRLRWTQPAQTITTGFGSMGQGRYVHPQRRRTLTPHEAARLQTFPDWFDFGLDTRRGVLAKAIGNAVPPFLMLQLGELILPALVAERQSKAASG